jgi:tRNA nucleotidyltransferase/poly(A) polymerase
MNLSYHPNSTLENFGVKVYEALVENFQRTFFVGGLVRDTILKRKIVDIDIATEATPDQVTERLEHANISYSTPHKRYGVIIAEDGYNTVEITTFRTEQYNNQNRYPEVKYIDDPRLDSKRRDFTINALYLSLVTGSVLDYHGGIADLSAKVIRTVGEPATKFNEDPLRMVRAIRFKLELKFFIDSKTVAALKNNLLLLDKLSVQRMVNELEKISDIKLRMVLQEFINSRSLDLIL